ncbi:MAG TPA: hypothetical protein VNQ79_18665 [Blastocatellia bacterium]|nr:hypothetical protein [Blastocatellia bacterium]
MNDAPAKAKDHRARFDWPLILQITTILAAAISAYVGVRVGLTDLSIRVNRLEVQVAQHEQELRNCAPKQDVITRSEFSARWEDVQGNLTEIKANLRELLRRQPKGD